jgi:hypothetical protein
LCLFIRRFYIDSLATAQAVATNQQERAFTIQLQAGGDAQVAADARPAQWPATKSVGLESGGPLAGPSGPAHFPTAGGDQ